ncbi:glutamate racemase [Endomicrobiia bacterium]|nr:glutamate racemase [Endomicrobiia bacterium]GHT17466.1 glutamate racemase [Endomicrobiia bacterium]
MSEANPICVFDSGVGGLTVLKRIVAQLSDEHFVYFGDTARVPYGEKSKEELILFSNQILGWFETLNPKIVLMACNTSSSTTLDVVKDKFSFPILGLIQPAAQYIAFSKFKKVGIIATSATVKSKAYTNSILKLNPGIEITETACPGLVEIVEGGETRTPKAKVLVQKYVEPLLDAGVECIILGCTHYPYLTDIINDVTAGRTVLIDPAEFIVKEAVELLEKNNLLTVSGKGKREYFASGDIESFVNTAQNFFDDCKSAESRRF